MKTIYIAVAVIVVAVALAAGLLFNNSSTKSIRNNLTVSPQSTGSQDKTQTVTDTYVPYSSGILESMADKRRVLFFYANWCPTCRPADEDFSANSAKIPDDAVLIRVNYNDTETDQEEKALAEKYGVTYQHTFVQIDSQGEEVTKWNGGLIEELLSHIK